MIRGADAAFHPVTSVAFLDGGGPKHFTDFIDDVFKDMGDYTSSGGVYQAELTNDTTYTDTDDTDTGNITGFGFQIHSGHYFLFLYFKPGRGYTGIQFNCLNDYV